MAAANACDIHVLGMGRNLSQPRDHSREGVQGKGARSQGKGKDQDEGKGGKDEGKDEGKGGKGKPKGGTGKAEGKGPSRSNPY